MKTTLALIAAAVSLSAGEASAATTFFSDLGPGGSYNCCAGWAVGGPVSPAAPAESFTSLSSGEVANIDIAIGQVFSGTVNVSLWTDSGGALGTELGSWTVTPATFFGLSTTILTDVHVSGVSLVSGDSYFLELASAGTSSWNWNTIGATGTLIDSGATTPGDTLGAFEVVGAPEPATWALMLAGFAGMGAALRSRRARPAAA